MNNHCKGCVFHHDAKHPKDSIYAKTYNDWCCGYGKTVKKVIGHCKLNGGKTLPVPLRDRKIHTHQYEYLTTNWRYLVLSFT